MSDTETHTGRSDLARDVLEYLAKSIVDEEEAVRIEVSERGDRVELRLEVARDDMGKIIGKRGRIIRSIRSLARAAATSEGDNVMVEVVD